MAKTRKASFWLLVFLAAATGKVSAQSSEEALTLPPPAAVTAEPPRLPQAAQAPPGPTVQYLPDIQANSKRGSSTVFGQMIQNMLAPFRFFQPRRDPIDADYSDLIELRQPPTVSPAELAAARIKADELTVHRRLAAVRYLAKFDCQFNPEAEAGLLTALRTDRSEAVRFEAALALANVNCCTRKITAALDLIVKGSDGDGHPTETSARVKWAAEQALQCYAYYRGVVPESLPAQLPAQKSTPSELQRLGFVPATPRSPAGQPAFHFSSAPPPPLTPIAPIPDYELENAILRPTHAPTSMRNDPPPVVEIGFTPQP